MVLPVLGLLALGGAALGRGKINSMFDKQDARRHERSGVDLNDGTRAGAAAEKYAEAGQSRSQAIQEITAQLYDEQQAVARNVQSNVNSQRSAGVAMRGQDLAHSRAMIGINIELNKHQAAVETAQLRDQALLDAGVSPTALGTMSPQAKSDYGDALGTSNADYDLMSPAARSAYEAEQTIAREKLFQEREMIPWKQAIEEQGLRNEYNDLQNPDRPKLEAAQIAYSETVSPLIESEQLYTNAIDALDAGVGTSFKILDNADSEENRRIVETAVLKFRNDIFRDVLNRKDAPGDNEQKELKAAIESLSKNPLKVKNHEAVRRALENMREGIRNKISIEDKVLENYDDPMARVRALREGFTPLGTKR